MMHNLRTSIYCTSDLSEECLRTLGPGMGWLPEQLGLQADECNWGAAVEVDAIGEQQPKRMQWGAVEADTIGEQQLKWIDANAIKEQQLKRMQSGSSSSAQRAVRRWITHVGK